MVKFNSNDREINRLTNVYLYVTLYLDFLSLIPFRIFYGQLKYSQIYLCGAVGKQGCCKVL